MKGKNLNIFVRFGGLDLKNQKGFSSSGERTFHSPPCSRGFYAMPKIAQESFLLSGMDYYQPGVLTPYSKTSSEWDLEQWKEFERRRRNSKRKMRKEFYKKDGNVWHHLSDYVSPNEVISRSGAWIKTSLHCWRKAFSKSSLNDRYGRSDSNMDFDVSSINEAKGVSGHYSKDHYEVFFDEKV